MPSSTWSLQRLGDVLTREYRPVSVNPDALYREIGIRSHCKGIFHKPAALGSTIGEKRVFEVVPDALVLNIVFAWEQAIAVTSANEAGMIASHRFPMYRPAAGRCDVNFLRHFFATAKGKKLLELASPGGAGRNKTLGQKEFEKLCVLMPVSDSEQKRIAALLTTWDDAIAVAHALAQNARLVKRALLQQLLPKVSRHVRIPLGWRHARIGDLVAVNPPRPKRPDDGRVSFLPMKAVSEDGRVIKRYERTYEEVCSGFTSFADGDLIIAKITPCFENGKGALLEGLANGIGFGSTEFHVLRPKNECNARLLSHVVSSHEFRRRGESEMEGSAGQKRISSDFIKSFRFACPEDPIAQCEVSQMLDAADRVVESYSALREHLKFEKGGLSQLMFSKAKAVS